MQKVLIITGILVFVLVTIFVLSVDDSSPRKKVQFTNQNLVINNENTEIKSENVNLDINQAKINNAQIPASNQNIGLQSNNLKFNNTNTSAQNIKFDNRNISNQNMNYNNRRLDYSNQNTNYNNRGTNYQDTKYNNQNTELDRKLADYERQRNRLKNIENSLKNRNPQTQRNNFENRYLVKNIDWRTWKSNFVNEIIDGSMSIKSLDTYPQGSWFYYSFYVDRDGSISDIKVSSMQISQEDRKNIANLIKSYEYKDVTVFPANSKRVRAKVDAIVMLGPTEKKSRPTDFDDTERIKIKMP